MQRLQHLQGLHLFGSCEEFDASVPSTPRAGLFAQHGAETVFILSTFSRRGVPMADVVPLRPPRDSAPHVHLAMLRLARSCAQAELKDLGLHFELLEGSLAVKRTTRTLRFRARGPGGAHGDSARVPRVPTTHTIAALSAARISTEASDDAAPLQAREAGCRIVMPAAAKRHVQETAAAGQEHHVAPQSRKNSRLPRFVLDLPMPWQLGVGGYRCRDCAMHFKVTPADVVGQFPDLLFDYQKKLARST